MYYINTAKKACYIFAFLLVANATHAQEISDHSIKKNITTIDSPLQKITQLQPKQFEYNAATFRHLKLKEGKQYGFIAEDIESVFPTLVNEKTVSYRYGKNVYRNATIKTINETSLIPVLVASVKEQQAEIEKLKAEMLELRKLMALSSN
ncbi:tail fiber domain-containing protein [Agriterribacter sp.]|uniref:tail fiber domain-containing protein n=1 Tax=Agriterribacter sp. TaxID=2821509 RepID=UPI002C643E78|nr:tail fiber domain-containing protein [Agriterribacter sp.]HRP57811.1 tail fiber domain-containing protein [Agriterribacter sp.]